MPVPGTILRYAGILRACFRKCRQRIFSPEEVRKAKWKRMYFDFRQSEREYLMLSIADFCRINRPIDGYYLEFGSYGANTMRLAWDHFQWMFSWMFVAFDSFEGLPEIQDIDQQAIWQKGKLKMEEEKFIHCIVQHGMPRDRLLTVKGFYDVSLTKELQQKLLPMKAAVIYIDCDLYHSTVPILRFIPPFLQKGTIIVFDDWNCFHGDPTKGERRAFREFQEEHLSWRFEPFVSTHTAQAFIALDGEQRPHS